ncbi:non-homologous end-joining DNA ligase [Gorillibacterium massiliense]|uniref:non-homologous end-joining DNA ligase n=1 Tax=Gorillibacterium massiliense TaxID=1280390 RepID=UPI0004ACF959|nr:non-homologous end-joining DNA ligase [Gorillibacterium massiliense]
MAIADKGTIVVDGFELVITNPEKPLWPDVNITKFEYLQKLVALAPYLLSYCESRYLTTIRYPHGIDGKSFYQKNAPEPRPAFVRTAVLGDIEYCVLDSLATLLWLGNLACLEFHPSFHRIGEDLPAEWVIDVDPTLTPEPRIMHAALLIGEALEKMGINSVPKTSGATGVQLYVPIEKGHTFEQLRRIGEFLGKYLVQKHPHLFTIERFIKNRGDKIYIDYLQHWHGKTLSAPYTPRARPGGTVSTPLRWQEVEDNPDPRDFNLRTIEDRLRTTGDLIKQIKPQSLQRILDFFPG